MASTGQLKLRHLNLWHRGRWPLALAGALALAALTSSGCPDAEGQFDEFLNNTSDQRIENDESVGGEGGPTGAVNLTGSYHLSLNAIIKLGTPIQFFVEAEFTDDGTDTNSGTLRLLLKPLTLDVGSLDSPRVMLTDADILLENIAVSEGRFEAKLEQVTVPGVANPITGANIRADINLNGVILSDDISCGIVTGQVFEPVNAPLAGSSFGIQRVDPGAASDPSLLPSAEDLLLECPDDVPSPEGTEEDPTTEDPTTEDPTTEDPTTEDPTGSTCPNADLAGTWDLWFQTEVQTEPTSVDMVLEADEDNCYVGSVVSQTSGDAIATIEFVSVTDAGTVVQMRDFVIPPGATALLPDGGLADVEMTLTSDENDFIMCGTIVYTLTEPFPLSSAGTFAAANKDQAEPATVSGPTCDDIAFVNPNCPEGDFTGTWELWFQTDVQTEPSTVNMVLAADTANCWSGTVVSPTSGDDIASIESFLKQDDDSFLLIMRDFLIPPGANALLPDGGVADVELTPTADLDSMTMCGEIVYNLKDPFPLSSAGDFATVNTDTSDATLSGPTCDDIE